MGSLNWRGWVGCAGGDGGAAGDLVLAMFAYPFQCLPDRFGLAGVPPRGGSGPDPDGPFDFEPADVSHSISIIAENGLVLVYRQANSVSVFLGFLAGLADFWRRHSRADSPRLQGGGLLRCGVGGDLVILSLWRGSLRGGGGGVRGAPFPA